jgi:hypothetical protein
MAEKHSRIRINGEHCLSEASCAAAEFGEHRKEPERPCRVNMVLGPFAETKGPHLPGRSPARQLT